MFGDFSRFENDPEIGLNGIYLSQGSPILDSDWNEQMAALTDWITVVGRLSAGDTLRRLGFDVSISNDVITISPGTALLSGRILQCSRTIPVKPKEAADQRVMTDSEVSWDKSTSCVISLICVDQASTANLTTQSSSSPCGLRGGIRSYTDWRILVSPTAMPESTIGTTGNVAEIADTEKMTASSAKSYGDSAQLTARMRISWNQLDAPFQSFAGNSTLCLIECDTANGGNSAEMRFKIASCPQNVISPVEWTSEPDKGHTGNKVTYDGHSSAVLNMLTAETTLWAEYEDDNTCFQDTLNLLKNINAIDIATSKLLKVKYDPQTRILKLEAGSFNQVAKARRPRLRLWNSYRNSGLRFMLFDPQSQPDADVSNKDRVQGEVLLNEGAGFLIPGDRWYLPIQDGMPAFISGSILSGHRVFRAIAPLQKITVDSNGKTTLATTQAAAVPAAALAISSDLIDSSPSVSLESQLNSGSRAHLQPVAHRLDDSLHRLTGALNAARALTRHTPCKELSTRVSYLPLRRWLASTYVHEIVDHDLDSFLAKVRRSVEVAPEDEHRFREQAALILEEANELAGRIPSGAEPMRRPQDIV